MTLMSDDSILNNFSAIVIKFLLIKKDEYLLFFVMLVPKI